MEKSLLGKPRNNLQDVSNAIMGPTPITITKDAQHAPAVMTQPHNLSPCNVGWNIQL